MTIRKTLFCLPYAGGSASIYYEWSKYLDSSIDIRPIELSGRGERINEPFYADVSEAVNDIFDRISQSTITGPYALFGHSMGAMLTYELARKIMLEGLNPPEHLFFSGRGVPDIKPTKVKNYHLMSDREFKEELLELGGTPPEIFENEELRQLFIPLLRSDFSLAEANFSHREVIPFECNISIMVGKKETLSPKRIQAWKNHTHGLCVIYLFNGGHFFIKNHGKEIASIINEKLASRAKITRFKVY